MVALPVCDFNTGTVQVRRQGVSGRVDSPHNPALLTVRRWQNRGCAVWSGGIRALGRLRKRARVPFGANSFGVNLARWRGLRDSTSPTGVNPGMCKQDGSIHFADKQEIQ
jgi:hypothetical protein